MLNTFRSAAKPTCVLALFLAALMLTAVFPAAAAAEVDCGAALSRCLNEQTWWQRIFDADYCFIGFLFCLIYLQ